MSDATAARVKRNASGRRNALSQRVMLVLAALLVLAGAAIYGILTYGGAERARMQDEWRIRLGIVADSRRAAVEQWLGEARQNVLRVGANRAVQFMLIDREDSDAPAEAIEDSRLYVESLLQAEAERASAAAVVSEAAQNAGIGDTSPSNYAVLDESGHVVAATPDLHYAGVDPAEIVAAREDDDAGHVVLAPLIQAPDGVPLLVLSAPILDPDGRRAGPIGHIVLLHRLGPAFFSNLHQPGDVDEGAETLLVSRETDQVYYLSPLGDGSAPLTRSVPVTDTGIAAVALSERPMPTADKIPEKLLNYQDQRVLAVGREVSGTNWTIVRMIDRQAALADGEARIRVLTIALMMGVLLSGAAVVAVWRHAVSQSLVQSSEQMAEAFAEAEQASTLLQTLADAIPNALIALDKDDRIMFGNLSAFESVGIANHDAAGMGLGQVFGPAVVEPLLDGVNEVRENGQPVRHVVDQKFNGKREIRQRNFVPLADKGVLLVTEDITEMVLEREARAGQMRSLIDVLVSVIDARDKFASDHSARVAEMSYDLAQEMDLEPDLREAAVTAARLMNLGKITIDPAILNKDKDLTDEELAAIRDAYLVSADLVSGIKFDAPVVDTLRALQERHDGSGRPDGLKGKEILSSAQVVALSNTYVALTSDRAHRKAMTPDQAVDILWAEGGKAWDRKAIAALVSLVEISTGFE